MYLIYFDPAVIKTFNAYDAKKNYKFVNGLVYSVMQSFKGNTKLNVVNTQGYLYNPNILGEHILNPDKKTLFKITLSLDKDEKKCCINILDTKTRRNFRVLNIPFYNDYNKLESFLLYTFIELFYVNSLVHIGDFCMIRENVYVWRSPLDKRRAVQ